MPQYQCPKCNGNDFAVDPWALVNNRTTSVKDLPVKCRKCGFEAKPSEFGKYREQFERKRKQDQEGFTIMEVLVALGAIGFVTLLGVLVAHCNWFTW